MCLWQPTHEYTTDSSLRSQIWTLTQTTLSRERCTAVPGDCVCAAQVCARAYAPAIWPKKKSASFHVSEQEG